MKEGNEFLEIAPKPADPLSTNLPVTAPSQGTKKARRAKLKLMFIIGAISAFAPLSIDMYLPGLPALAQDLAGTSWQVQLTLTACLIGLAAGQVVAGPLSDTLGRRRPLLVGLFLYTAASLLCAFAPSVPVLIALRVVQGAAGAAGIVIARATVRDLYSGIEMVRFFALIMAITGLAPILAPVIGGQLLIFTSWRGVFVVLGAIGLVLLLAVGLGWLPETLPPERRRSGGLGQTLATFRLLLLDRYFVGYALTSGLAFAGMFAYISASPFVLQDIYKVSPQVFSLIFGINALGLVAVSQIGARLVERLGSRKLMAIGLGIYLIGGWLLLAVVAANVGLPGILPALFMVVASVGFIAPNSLALALANHGKVSGSASALIGVLQFTIGAAVSPLVSIGGNLSAFPVAIIIALVGSGAVLSFLLLTRPR